MGDRSATSAGSTNFCPTPIDEYWVVDHRLAWDDWDDDEALLVDQDAKRSQWAVEASYPQLRIAGTVYNELRVERAELEALRRGSGLAAGAAAAAASIEEKDLRDMARGVRHLNFRRSPLTPTELPGDDEDDRIVERTGNAHVRRTWVRRGRSSVERARLEIAEHVLQVRQPDVDVSPDPAPERCSSCVYAEPCAMLEESRDVGPIMASEFRRRKDEEFEEDGLRWSAARRASRASLGGAGDGPRTVNFRWG